MGFLCGIAICPGNYWAIGGFMEYLVAEFRMVGEVHFGEGQNYPAVYTRRLPVTLAVI